MIVPPAGAFNSLLRLIFLSTFFFHAFWMASDWFLHQVDRIERSGFGGRDKAVLKLFLNYLRSVGISDRRIKRYVDSLLAFGRYLGWSSLEDVDVNRMRRFVTWCYQHYKPWSRITVLSNIKSFYRWLFEGGKRYEELAGWIKVKLKPNERDLPRTILSVDEVNRMASVAENPRDKAIILTLYELGCRPEEFLNLRIGDVQWDKYGAIITVKGKTGARRLRLISSAPALADWLNQHPSKDDPKAPLFPNYLGEKMTFRSLDNIIKRYARKAGITKHVTPRTFRHSRATFLARHLTESQLCYWFGWVQGSDMPRTYVHLSGRDLDTAVLKLAGIQVQEEEGGEAFKAKTCPRCKEKNAPSDRFCKRCGSPLDPREVLQTPAEPELLNKVKEMAEAIESLKKTQGEMAKIIKSITEKIAMLERTRPSLSA